MSAEILDELFIVVKDRKEDPRKESYVCSLFDSGEDRILQKVGEEAVEFILASKSSKREDIIYECADLVFHIMVSLGYKGIELEEIYKELEKRRK